MKILLLLTCIGFYPLAVFAESSEVPSGKSFAPVDDLKTPIESGSGKYIVVPGKDPDGWSFTVEPYLWALGMSGDVGVKGLPATHVDYSSKTILQHLDWGIMAKGEIRKGRWGILGDGLFAQLSADGDPPGPLYETGSVKVQQGMTSLALAYRLFDDRRGFVDIYAGARYNYLGFNVGASVDSGAIEGLSDRAAALIANGAAQRVDTYLAQNAAALESTIVSTVAGIMTNKVLANDAQFPRDLRESLDRREIVRLFGRVESRSGSYHELLLAVVQARVAAANGQLTPELQNNVVQAQKKFSRDLARQIEKALPSSAEGSQWWVDPIVGLRGQFNFTRWLFLAAQADAGGFGAGSQIAFNASASLGVNFTRNLFGELGYRYFYMDYNKGGALYKAAEGGLFMGFGVKF